MPAQLKQQSGTVLTSLRLSGLCVVFLLAVWLLSVISVWLGAETSRVVGFINIGILFLFALSAVAAFLFSAAGIYGVISKPDAQQNKWLALFAFLVSSVLSLLGIAIVAAIVSVIRSAV